MKTETKGYKVTDKNLQCRGYQFELNKRFKHSGKISICINGFHFCEQANDCFNYYSFNSENRVFEVIAYGKLDTEGDKHCCSEIEMIRELTWLEVLSLCNIGKNNTGRSNTGDSNTGYSNTGNWNTGNWNTGNRNTGDRNTGDSNTGDSNTGNCNTGNRNTGDSNTGYSNTGNRNTGNRNTGDSNTGNWNTGNRNTGDRNTGDSNTGDRNTGYRNTGNWNTGNRNTGDRNTGYRNTGDSNTGNWNTGNRNTGDSNTGYRNGGAFCTDNNPKLILFDVQTDILIKDWEQHKAVELMYQVNPNIWVWSNEMTEEEKVKFPTHEIAGGYLKSIPMKEAWSNFWGNLSEENKKVFTDLPNFDADKFEFITGIRV